MAQFLKICCIADVEEARMAAMAGATHIGLVGPMPSGPGQLPLDQITKITRMVRTWPASRPNTVLLSQTVDARIVEEVEACGPDAVQLVRDAPEARAALRAAAPLIDVVQVVHVGGPSALAAALRAQDADALLLDSGQPNAATPSFGGTGSIHDWTISREIVAQSAIPVFLAGGLNPANIEDAIEAVRPHGLDVCSGLRTGERLDIGKLMAFCDAARRFGFGVDGYNPGNPG